MCNEIVAVGSEFIEHMATEHGEPILKCPRKGCDYRTNEIIRLERHGCVVEKKEELQMVRDDF